jgi:hypothetical protein
MTMNTQGHETILPIGGLRLWDTSATWPSIETANGTYSYTTLDAWLAEAQMLNADVTFTVGGQTPPWAITGSCTGTYSGSSPKGCAQVPSDIGSGDNIWKAFITALVKHSLASSTAHIKFYECWNEPDLTGTFAGTVPQLVTLCHDLYTTVHALDPNALVIGPSPSTGCTNNCGIHTLPTYYAYGGAPYEDIVGMHAYMYQFQTTPEPISNIVTQLQTLMTANGIGALPIFFTEGNEGNSTQAPISTMTDAQKVAYLMREYLLMWMVPQVQRYYWYAWDNANYGTLYSNGALTQAGIAYKTLQSWLVGSTHPANQCSKDSNGTWSCTLIYQGNPALILWNQTTTPSTPVPETFAHVLSYTGTRSAIVANAVTAGPIPQMAVPDSWIWNCTGAQTFICTGKT